MTKLRKTDWFRGINSGTIAGDEIVSCWALPHGALCEVLEVDGVSVLRNGRNNTVNDVLSTALLDAGISGDVIVNSNKSIPQTISKWLTWWLSTQVEDSVAGLKPLRVATFGISPTKELPFEVDVLNSFSSRADEVISMLYEKSMSDSLSAMLIKRASGECYELVPVRHAVGTVVSHTEFGYVLRMSNRSGATPVLVGRVSRRLNETLCDNDILPVDLVGRKAQIQYTMSTEGPRLCTHKTPMLNRVVDLEMLDYDADRPNLTGGVIYPSPLETTKPSPLTVTWCSRAMVVSDTDSIRAVEVSDESEVLYEMTPGAKGGTYAALLMRHDRYELWQFHSKYSIDSLTQEGFIKYVDEQFYHATGYSIVALGLHYTDYLGDTWVGTQNVALDGIGEVSLGERCFA